MSNERSSVAGHGDNSFTRDLRVGFRIAFAEVRHQFRTNLNTRLEKGLLALTMPMLLFLVVSFFEVAYDFGVTTRDGTTLPVVHVARASFLPVVVVLSLFSAMYAMNSIARDSVRELLLTSGSRRALIIGKILYTLYTQLFFLGFAVVLLVGYTAGARAPLFLIAVLAAGIPVLVLVQTLGLSLGYLFWIGTERLGLSERIRRLLTPVISILFLTAWILLINLQEDIELATMLANRPITLLGWYTDLFFIGSPLAVSLGLRTVLAAGIVLGALPLMFRALVRLAPAYWYATPVAAAETTQSGRRAEPVEFDQTPSETIGRESRGLVSRWQTVRVARGYMLDGIRRPDQFLYFFIYLFMGTVTLSPVAAQAPELFPTLLGIGLVLVGVFLGGVFCLNPFGHEKKMLSQLALAAVPAHTFVNGRIIAGTVIGTPFALVGVLVLGAFSETLAILQIPLAVVLAPPLVFTSVCFAQGVGSGLPNYETTEVFNIETLKPSRLAVYMHAGLLLSLTASGIGVTFLANPSIDLSVPLRIGVLAIYLSTLGLVADGGRRYAIGKLDGYGRQRPEYDRVFAIEAAIALAAVSFVFAQTLALVAARFVGESIPVQFGVQYAAFAIVALGFLYVTRRGMGYLALGWPSLREGLSIPVVVVVSLGIALGGTALLTGLDLPGIDNSLSDPASNRTPGEDMSSTTLAVFALAMVFVVGPVEELLYRNVIQEYLTEWYATLPAVGIASGIFALAHVPSYFVMTGSVIATGLLLSVLFVVSMLWGLIFAKTRRLFVVAAIHGLYNASLVGLVALGLGPG